MDILIKRIYEPAAVEDGYRILVDRLWPRGISKAQAELHAWMPLIAPSDALRTWFGHEPARWERFQQRYFEELADQAKSLEMLRLLASAVRVTLLYAARDERHNNARALRGYLLRDDEGRGTDDG